MDKTTIGAAGVSLDGFIADDHDRVGPLFDWNGNGDLAWTFEGANDQFRKTPASADFIRDQGDVAAMVVGRHLFDVANGWNGTRTRSRKGGI